MCLPISLLIVLFPLDGIAYAQLLPEVGSHPTLKMRRDGTFRLALFCDMHFGEAESKDELSVQFQTRLLELEKPDLVIVDGDASSNYASHWCPFKIGCHNFFRNNWKKFTKAFVQARTPYAYTLGNHDRIPWHIFGPEHPGGPGFETDYAVTDHWIMELDEHHSTMAMAHDGPTNIHGASNYVIPVFGGNGAAAFYVWMLDSSDNNCLGIQGWGCVYPDQVEWFRKTSRRLKQQDGRVVPGVMFHHIPLPEVLDAWNNGSIELNGTLGESICCFSANTGLFDAIKEAGNIWGVFHGHDHNNDFIARYEGITIGFGRKSGYGGYGGVLADHPGSRIIDVTLQPDGSVSWETRIRLETGEIVAQEPVPPERRSEISECCGMKPTAASEQSSDGHVIDMKAATYACRVHDEVNMCRIASGMQPLKKFSDRDNATLFD
eukprot:TRINITY_DN29513_c0_g1_i1.p1 TRINITY_DN29513_c0_g1~~TRINITY_DN29513_c0_g1_i1.p1  ORF type:complete len:484 (-),score=53.38 TRINITY_DN29513_c0_g1_i1:302-1603(-)